MTEFGKFFRTKTFLIPVGVIVAMELLLQAGCYSPFLKKNSYAANVNRILNHVIDKKDVLDPEILVFGTSVGYQGLSVPRLNQRLAPHKINSIAIPGSELIVQELAVRKALKNFDNIKTVIHVMELTMPWVNKNELALPTLAMIAEINRPLALQKIYEYEYDVRRDDVGYIMLRSVAYRRDMKDVFFNGDKRLKDFVKSVREGNDNYYDYENSYTEAISMYSPVDLKDCQAKTGPANTDPIPAGSNKHHKKALYDTCSLGLVTRIKSTATPESEEYFRRLKLLYAPLQEKNIRIINVFAPYSDIISHLGGPERLQHWRENLERILGPENTTVIDMQYIFRGKNSGEYFYDLIHLNKKGMLEFSDRLADELPDKL